MTTYLLAGGGTAGHVNPLLAVADALRAREPDAEVLVLGTREGLESRLVPERGYELLFVDKLPQGLWEIRYESRAEIPGEFHALPVVAHAMYVPEIRANSVEQLVQVIEK